MNGDFGGCLNSAVALAQTCLVLRHRGRRIPEGCDMIGSAGLEDGDTIHVSVDLSLREERGIA